MNTFTKYLLLAPFILAGILSTNALGNNKIHALGDISHQFSYYTKNDFVPHYLKDHQGKINWGTLYDNDTTNINLIFLLECHPFTPYTNEDVQYLTSFMESGGTVFLLGKEGKNPQNDLAQKFGAKFSNKAQAPLRGESGIHGKKVFNAKIPACFMRLDDEEEWEILVTDQKKRPVLARKTIGKGYVIIGSRALVGSNQNESINRAWITPLLEESCSKKPINPDASFDIKDIISMGNSKVIDNIEYQYPDYLRPHVEMIIKTHGKCIIAADKFIPLPAYAEERLYMISLTSSDTLMSLGEYVMATGVFWGGYPKDQTSMANLITNRLIKSRLLPHREIWHEPIATYATLQAMSSMGYSNFAKERIASTVAKARRYDPKMVKFNPYLQAGENDAKLSKNQQEDVLWGKSYLIFEELKKMDSGFLAKYFKMKRQLLPQDSDYQYTLEDTIAVMGRALNKDLFPLFAKYGIKADPGRASIENVK